MKLVKVELKLDSRLVDRVYRFAVSDSGNIVDRIDAQEMIESDLGHAALLQIVQQMHQAALDETTKKEVAA